MSPDLIDPAILFAEPDHGSCCDCCEGYCPLCEDPHTDGFDRLVSVTVGGVEYLGTNACLIRRDRQNELPEKIAERVIEAKKVKPIWASVPEEKPEPDGRPQSAQLLDRLERCGIDRRVGDEIVHLYIGDEHVGWCMWNKGPAGTLIEDLPLIRTMAQECGITLPTAAVALHFARGGEVAC